MHGHDPKGRKAVRVPIGWKLLLATAVVGVVAAAIAVLGLARMHVLNERFNTTVEVAAKKVKLAAVLKQDLAAVTRIEQHIILANSEEEVERFADTIDELLTTMMQREDELRDLTEEAERPQIDEFRSKWIQWQRNHHEVRNFAKLNSNVRARELSFEQGAQQFDALEKSLEAAESRFSQEAETTATGEDEEKRAYLAQKTSLIGDIQRGAIRLNRAEKNLILARSDEQVDRYEQTIKQLAGEIAERFSSLRNLTPSDDEDQGELNRMSQAFEDYLQTNAEIRRLVHEKGNFLADYYAEQVGGPLAYDCELLLGRIAKHNEQEMRDYQAASNDTYINARNTLLAFSIVGIVVSVTASFFVGQRIAANLRTLADYAHDIQRAGDLSRPVPKVGRDEVGELAAAFDDMRSKLYDQTSRLAALNKTLERKNEEMEQFVYTVSHDLKSPLVSCKGLIGLIREDIADANYVEVEASADKLDTAADQLSQIIDDLLALSRLGRKTPELGEVDVRSVVDNLQSELADRLEAIGARLEVHEPLPAVTADASDFKRVLENLLTNAIKYGCDGPTPVITFGAAEGQRAVCYYVRDSGPGIDPAYHEKVFGLFQRLDTTKPGTGLGLASVAKIMKLHGGRVWVESAPGEGATFWIEFPKSVHAAGRRD